MAAWFCPRCGFQIAGSEVSCPSCFQPFHTSPTEARTRRFIGVTCSVLIPLLIIFGTAWVKRRYNQIHSQGPASGLPSMATKFLTVPQGTILPYGGIPICRTEAGAAISWIEMNQGAPRNDNDYRLRAANAGIIQIIPCQTPVIIEQQSANAFYVRILDGAYTGQEGWAYQGFVYDTSAP